MLNNKLINEIKTGFLICSYPGLSILEVNDYANTMFGKKISPGNNLMDLSHDINIKESNGIIILFMSAFSTLEIKLSTFHSAWCLDYFSISKFFPTMKEGMRFSEILRISDCNFSIQIQSIIRY